MARSNKEDKQRSSK